MTFNVFGSKNSYVLYICKKQLSPASIAENRGFGIILCSHFLILIYKRSDYIFILLCISASFGM